MAVIHHRKRGLRVLPYTVDGKLRVCELSPGANVVSDEVLEHLLNAPALKSCFEGDSPEFTFERSKPAEPSNDEAKAQDPAPAEVPEVSAEEQPDPASDRNLDEEKPKPAKGKAKRV